MLCVVTEVTERVIGERRLRVLRDLAARGGGVESVDETCRRACEVLALYPFDTPFAALYLIDPGAHRARRAARTRELPEAALPETLALDGARSPWHLRELLESETQQLEDLQVAGLDIPAGPWPDRVKQALILPLKGTKHGLGGFLIAGVSPRLLLDDDYRSFWTWWRIRPVYRRGRPSRPRAEVRLSRTGQDRTFRTSARPAHR
jgi:hypothetical protein